MPVGTLRMARNHVVVGVIALAGEISVKTTVCVLLCVVFCGGVHTSCTCMRTLIHTFTPSCTPPQMAVVVAMVVVVVVMVAGMVAMVGVMLGMVVLLVGMVVGMVGMHSMVVVSMVTNQLGIKQIGGHACVYIQE